MNREAIVERRLFLTLAGAMSRRKEQRLATHAIEGVWRAALNGSGSAMSSGFHLMSAPLTKSYPALLTVRRSSLRKTSMPPEKCE
jgi:hypothetical protein